MNSRAGVRIYLVKETPWMRFIAGEELAAGWPATIAAWGGSLSSVLSSARFAGGGRSQGTEIPGPGSGSIADEEIIADLGGHRPNLLSSSRAVFTGAVHGRREERGLGRRWLVHRNRKNTGNDLTIWDPAVSIAISIIKRST
jgi:hypothetical protein